MVGEALQHVTGALQTHTQTVGLSERIKLATHTKKKESGKYSMQKRICLFAKSVKRDDLECAAKISEAPRGCGRSQLKGVVQQY